MKELCAAKTAGKNPGRLSEGVERRATYPLQKTPIHQSYEIEVDDSEVQGESSC